MVKSAASSKSLKKTSNRLVKTAKPGSDTKASQKLVPLKKSVVHDVMCCCDLDYVESAIPSVLNTVALASHCSMWFKQYNYDTGYVPTVDDFSPGFLACYIVDCIAHYCFRVGGFVDTPPYDMGSLPVPFTLACLIRESFGKKRYDGSTFIPRLPNLTNSFITSQVYSASGSFGTYCIDETIPLLSGEPVFSAGTSFSVSSIRPLYRGFAVRIAAYGGIPVNDIPMYCKGFDFYHNRTTMVSNIPSTYDLCVCTPNSGAFGAARVISTTNTYLEQFAAYHWIMSHYKDPKMTYRKALVQCGYDPMSFTIRSEEINLSKLRGLITTFAQYRGNTSWGSAEQSEFLTSLVAFVSQVLCKTPPLMHNIGTVVPCWTTRVWRDLPTLACIAELGTIPRRVDNTLWFPFLDLPVYNYPAGCSLMALIQESVPVVADFSESVGAFPFDFTFVGSLQVCGHNIPAVASRINFVPLYVYSEAAHALAGYNQEFLVPMPKPKYLVPANIDFVKGNNVTQIGTMTLYLPKPSNYSCFAACDNRDCSILPGLGLFTKQVVGKYAGFASDTSGEYWIRLIRASAVVTANVVAAGTGGNAPQTTITKMFYNQLLGPSKTQSGYISSRDLLSAADKWRREGNPVPSVSEGIVSSVLSGTALANTAVAVVAGALYTLGGVRAMINGRPGYNVLFPGAAGGANAEL